MRLRLTVLAMTELPAMLARFRARNFVTCDDVGLDELTPFAAVIGPNGSGKTNILNAIRVACDFASGKSTRELRRGAGRVPRSKSRGISFEFDVAAGTDVFTYSLSLYDRRAAEIEESIRINGEAFIHRENQEMLVAGRSEAFTIGNDASSLGTLSTILSPDDSILQRIQKLTQFVSHVRYYPLDEPRESSQHLGWKIYPKDAYEKRAAAESGDLEDIVTVRILHLWHTNREKFEELVSYAGPNGLGVVETIQPTAMVDPRDKEDTPEKADAFYLLIAPRDSDRFVSFNVLSAGTRRVLTLLTHFVMDDASLMLIEQPEDALHPGMTTKLVSLLRANATDRQIIATSHSAALLNRLKPEEVYLTGISEGRTTEKIAAIAYMNEDGSLADFLSLVQG
jgi:predicted ATPase